MRATTRQDGASGVERDSVGHTPHGSSGQTASAPGGEGGGGGGSEAREAGNPALMKLPVALCGIVRASEPTKQRSKRPHVINNHSFKFYFQVIILNFSSLCNIMCYKYYILLHY